MPVDSTVALQAIIGSYTPLTRLGDEWLGPCVFAEHAELLHVAAERWHCPGCSAHEIYGNDAVGFLRLAEDCSAEHAQTMLDAGLAWTPTLLRHVVPAKYGLQLVAERPGVQVVVLDGYMAAAAAAKLLPKSVCVAWHASVDPAPLYGRTVVLWPTNTAPAVLAMQRLGEHLSRNGCSGKLVDPTEQADGWSAAAWQGTQADLLAWLRSHALAIPAPTPLPEPEPEPARIDEPEPPPEPPPEADTTPQPPKRPRAARRPRLAAIDGNLALEPDPDAIPLALSESGVAAEFVALHRDKYRCVHEWATAQGGPAWMVWNGARWVRDPTRVHAWKDAEALCRTLKNRAEAAGMTWAGKLKLEKKTFISAVRDIAQMNHALIVPGSVFDADLFLLGCPSGTIDLRTGMFREPRTGDYITRSTLVDPRDGPTPLFDRVVACATNGESDAECYLWRYFGYLLTGSCQDEQFTFLRGDEGSGKGTLVKCLAEILHEYGCVSDMEAFTDSRTEKMPQHRAKLEGFRFTHASETNQNRKWNESQINYLTGRDKVEGQKLYENKRDFSMTCKVLIYGNYVPKLRTGIGMGIKRRLHLIEYDNKIEEPDTTLKERIVAEYPAILARMVEGCLDWQRLGGLGKPERIASNVSAYLTDQDDINAWCDECLDATEGNQLGASSAYQSYKAWAHANSMYCPSSKEFSVRLKQRGWQAKHTAGGNVFIGWALKLGAAPSTGWNERDVDI